MEEAQKSNLLGAIYKEPMKDAPKLVFADWLMEQGDPRGEFIMLQFKRAETSLTYAERKRESALLSAHEETWLGGIAKLVEAPIFKKGFLSECTVRSAIDLRLMRQPEWTTVRRLAGGPNVIHAPRLVSLQSIGPIEPTVLVQLQTRPPLPRVTELIIEPAGSVRSAPADWVPHLNMLPNLRCLAIQYPEHIPNARPRTLRSAPYAALLDRPDIQGVCSFAIRRRVILQQGQGSPADEWVRLAPWIRFCKAHERLKKLRLEISRGWAFRIHQTQDGLLLVAEWNSRAATGSMRALRYALETIPQEDIARIHIEQSGVRLPHHAEALERALEGFQRVSFHPPLLAMVD